MRSVKQYLGQNIFQPLADIIPPVPLLGIVNFGQNYSHLRESRTVYIIIMRALVAYGKQEQAQALHTAIMDALASMKVTFMQDSTKCVVKDKKNQTKIKFVSF